LNERYNFFRTKEHSAEERQALNSTELQEMNELVDFQSHTASHPILTQCTTDEIMNELGNSKRTLELLLHKPIVHLSYPNGAYNDQIIAAAKAVGYQSARTAVCGWNDAKTDPFTLRIVGVSEKAYDHRFELDLLGFPLFIINIADCIGKFIRTKSLRELQAVCPIAMRTHAQPE
jgi:peptidoglycan/xylan/chitin deacetylase (PgdA/CDA1 family)